MQHQNARRVDGCCAGFEGEMFCHGRPHLEGGKQGLDRTVPLLTDICCRATAHRDRVAFNVFSCGMTAIPAVNLGFAL